MAAYFIAGEGRAECLFLLPALGGYLIWEAWVDKKGGAVVIANNGGLGGGPGQMVSFAALLMGLSLAMNIIFLPILVWMFWRVLSKSGLRTGLAILVIGLVPVFCFSGWGAYSLGADMRSLLPFSLPLDEGALYLLPNVFDDRKFNCSDLIRGVDDRKRPRQRRAKSPSRRRAAIWPILWPSTMLVSSSHERPTKLSRPPPHSRSPRIKDRAKKRSDP